MLQVLICWSIVKIFFEDHGSDLVSINENKTPNDHKSENEPVLPWLKNSGAKKPIVKAFGEWIITSISEGGGYKSVTTIALFLMMKIFVGFMKFGDMWCECIFKKQLHMFFQNEKICWSLNIGFWLLSLLEFKFASAKASISGGSWI